MIEKEGTETLVSVNLGDAVEHSALFPALSSYSTVDSKEHASFINSVWVDSFKMNLLCDWRQNSDAREGD